MAHCALVWCGVAQGWSARCVFICLWLLGTPFIFTLATTLERTWIIVPIIYAFFAAALGGCSACANWNALALGVVNQPSSSSSLNSKTAKLLPKGGADLEEYLIMLGEQPKV